MQSILVHIEEDLGPQQHFVTIANAFSKKKKEKKKKTVNKSGNKKMNITVDKYPRTNTVKILHECFFFVVKHVM